MATADIGVGGTSAARGASGGYYEDVVTGWTGWIGFGATMLILIGAFHAIAGFVGIFKDGYYVAPKRDLLVTVDYTAWGWAHLILGLLAIGVAIGMLAGKTWARVLGVAFAVISAVVNLGFLQAQPVWSTMIIAFDVLLIWALTVHGSEMKALREEL